MFGKTGKDQAANWDASSTHPNSTWCCRSTATCRRSILNTAETRLTDQILDFVRDGK